MIHFRKPLFGNDGGDDSDSGSTGRFCMIDQLADAVACGRPIAVGNCGIEGERLVSLFTFDPSVHQKVFTPLSELEYEYGQNAWIHLTPKSSFWSVSSYPYITTQREVETVDKHLNGAEGELPVADDEVLQINTCAYGQGTWSARLSRNGLLTLNQVTQQWHNVPLGQAAKYYWFRYRRPTRRLGGLPLAFVQAGAYLRETNMSIEQYLKFYDKTWATLMKPEDQYPLQGYRERSVLTTWKMSYKQVLAVDRQAAGLLDQWAFLHAGDVWYELAASSPQVAERDGTAEGTSTIATDKLSFRHSLGVLSHYSLVVADAEGTGFSYTRWCTLGVCTTLLVWRCRSSFAVGLLGRSLR
ncbi:hypothetical protein LTR37_019173 [Vermiconidia calcicola]|uniref:Uncharacterized protein n=1 Tax=Vermiconidia calcicola TaxID=1690605 RepID=A0ACC3MF76_9PEZI|nr:hypothetical protein LTR37_019173 [Vermiconidia calcicola]